MFTITDPCYAADISPEWQAVRQKLLDSPKPLTEVDTPLGKAKVLSTGEDGNFFGCCVDSGMILVIPGKHDLPKCAMAAHVNQAQIDSISSGAIQNEQAFRALLEELGPDILDNI
jgi:hypothetical protein